MSSYSAAVLADSPIRYYRLGETSGTVATDSGSGAQNGTIAGGVTLNQTSLILTDTANASMLFNGSTGKITTSSTGLPTGASAWTMECWVNISASPATYQIITDFGTRVTNEEASIYFDTAGKVNVGFNGAGNVVAPTSLSTGVNHHLVATYTGTTLTLYIDGASVGTPVTTTGAIVSGSGFIGCAADGTTLFYAGRVDEVAIYSTALSASRVLAHYTAATSVALTATVVGTGTFVPALSLSVALSRTLIGSGQLSGSLSATLTLGGISLVGIGQLSPTFSATLTLTGTSLLGIGTLTVLLQTNLTTLSLYGSNVAASTLTTAGNSAITTGGVEIAAVTTAPASGSGYMECFALGGTSTVNASLPVPSGGGWILDLPLLEGMRLVADTWTASVAVSNANGGGPVNSYTIRFWQRSSVGIYTAIGSLVLSASQVISTLRVVKTFVASAMPQTDFAVGDKLYIDFFINANGWASDVLSVYVASSGTAGVVGDLEVDTAGYIPSGAGGIVTSYIPRALSALLVITSTALATTTSGSGTLVGGTFSLTTALAPTLAATGILAAVLSANETLAGGTLSGTSQLTGTLALAMSLSGTTLAGIGQLTGSVQLTSTLAGTSAGVGALSAASFQLATTLGKTFAGAGTLTPALTASFTLSGASLPGVGTLSGAASLATALGSTLTGGGQLAGTLQASAGVALGSTLAGGGILTPTLSAVETLSGTTLAGGGILAGPLSANMQLASITLPGVGILIGAVSLRTALADTMSGMGTLTGAISASFTLSSATLVGVATLTGAESLATSLSTTLTGAGALTGGAPTLKTALANSIGGIGTLAGSISGGGALALTMAGTSAVVGVFSLATTLTGNAAGAGLLAGTLSARMALTNTLGGMGNVAGTFSLLAAEQATLAGTSTLSGVSVLTTYLLVTLPGSSGVAASTTRVTLLTCVYTGVGQFSPALVIGGALATCLFAGIGQCTGALSFPGPSATATWKTRDMKATWIARDDKAVWIARDDKAVWKTRR